MLFAHWLIGAGACLLLVGSYGLAFHQGEAEPPGDSLKRTASPDPLGLSGPKAGPKTVREVREISGETLLSFRSGKGPVTHLREIPGLPSSNGFQPSGKKPT
jgi:hypothetical protein